MIDNVLPAQKTPSSHFHSSLQKTPPALPFPNAQIPPFKVIFVFFFGGGAKWTFLRLPTFSSKTPPSKPPPPTPQL